MSRTIAFEFTCKQCGWLNTSRDAETVALPGGVDLAICDFCGAVWAVRVLKWNLNRKGAPAGHAKGLCKT